MNRFAVWSIVLLGVGFLAADWLQVGPARAYFMGWSFALLAVLLGKPVRP